MKNELAGDEKTMPIDFGSSTKIYIKKKGRDFGPAYPTKLVEM